MYKPLVASITTRLISFGPCAAHNMHSRQRGMKFTLSCYKNIRNKMVQASEIILLNSQTKGLLPTLWQKNIYLKNNLAKDFIKLLDDEQARVNWFKWVLTEPMPQAVGDYSGNVLDSDCVPSFQGSQRLGSPVSHNASSQSINIQLGAHLGYLDTNEAHGVAAQNRGCSERM